MTYGTLQGWDINRLGWTGWMGGVLGVLFVSGLILDLCAFLCVCAVSACFFRCV